MGVRLSAYQKAKQLTTLGFKVFPIAAGAKFPPLVRHWPEEATADADKIAEWWTVWEDANIGIHCEGFVVVDVDVKKGGHETLVQYANELPLTLTTVTPTGGMHLFYRLPVGHPGVKNGVDVLGPGLDIRSTRGYVVAPGSVIGEDEYSFDPTQELEPVPAPDWLVQKCGVFAERERKVELNIPDAPPEDYERAYEWLKDAPRSVKGQGGDETAYRVACELRDRGMSYSQACDLMRSDAWDDGCGWREDWLEDKPIASAYKYAQNADAGSKIAQDDDFAMSDEPVEEKPKSRRMVQSLRDFAQGNNSNSGYIIKGLLYARSLALMVGQPGQGKTFLALDMAYHVAAGREYMGRRVKQSPVLYLPFEGLSGLPQRGEALIRKHGDGDVPLYRCDSTGLDLRKPECRKELASLIAELPEIPKLVIIDTFHKALQGADENSSADVGLFLEAVSGLIRRGMCVLLLHHPGKANNGPRGSSALHAAMDTELTVSDHAVYVSKQRDVELSEPMGFRLVPIMVGEDEDGDILTSCYVEPAPMGDVAGLPPLKGHSTRVWSVLCKVRPDNAPISRNELEDACIDSGMDIPNRRNWLWDALEQMERKGYVEINDKMISRKLV